jgi:hypothetical protein
MYSWSMSFASIFSEYVHISSIIFLLLPLSMLKFDVGCELIARKINIWLENYITQEKVQ